MKSDSYAVLCELSVIMKTIRAFIIVLTSAALVSCASHREAKPNREAGVPAEVLEKRECQRNLEDIYIAIKGYQAAHKQLPNWLSDLVPGALSNTNVLICPVARREGVKTYPGLEDPRIATSYTYDFCNREVPSTVWGGSATTMRDWKNRQRTIYGDDVPMVRCTHHERVLNVSYGGKIFESSVTWEDDPEFQRAAAGRNVGPNQ